MTEPSYCGNNRGMQNHCQVYSLCSACVCKCMYMLAFCTVFNYNALKTDTFSTCWVIHNPPNSYMNFVGGMWSFCMCAYTRRIMSKFMVQVQCCFMSTERWGAQDGDLDFHTAPQVWSLLSHPKDFCSLLTHPCGDYTWSCLTFVFQEEFPTHKTLVHIKL